MITDSSQLFLGLVWFVVFLFSTTLHEASHAFIALRLGDPTAYRGGQVTLNPIPHIQREPFGMVVIPIISFVLGGWMFGWASAPYDPQWSFRHPRRAAWMAAGGPASNLLLAVIAGLTIHIGRAAGWLYAPDRIHFSHVVEGAPGLEGLATFISVMFTLNLLLFAFNLLPLPPLDGSAMVQLFLSDDLSRRYQMFLAQPMVGLLGILLAWRIFGTVFDPIHTLSLKLLYPDLSYS